MNLADIGEEPLRFDLGENLSHVISKLYSEKRAEGFVFDKNQFVGIISAKDIIRKGVSNPKKVKLANLDTSIKRIRPFEPDTPLKDVIHSFLINNYRCVPVKRNGEILSLDKLNVLKLVATDSVKGKRASDLMFFPECVSLSDPISVVKSIFRSSNTYRLAVVSSGNKIEGVVDDVDLLKGFVEKTKSSRGEKSGEKIKEGDVPISSHLLMQGSYLSVSPQTELKYVIKSMLEKKQDTVVVEEDNRLLGMITPREILKLVGPEIGGIYVTVSGIQDEDDFIQSVVDSEIRSSIRKLGKIIHIHYMTLNVKKRAGGKSSDYKVKTKRTNYTINGKIVSNKGAFFANDNSWDLTKATHGALKKLEKEVLKKVGKERVYDRGPHGEDKVHL